MHQYRVTKYNPVFRDNCGAYTKQEWTSFNDIGRKFGNVIFSKEEYLRMESAYIKIAMQFLAEDGASALDAVGVENKSNSANAPSENKLISVEDLAAVCRSVLREEFWCRFEAGGRFLHFGYDYYMYVGVMNKCDGSIAAAHALGLFVEQFDSPYFEIEEESV